MCFVLCVVKALGEVRGREGSNEEGTVLVMEVEEGRIHGWGMERAMRDSGRESAWSFGRGAKGGGSVLR